jgi:hypothetical protein
MEAAGSPEILVPTYKSIHDIIPEDQNLKTTEDSKTLFHLYSVAVMSISYLLY